MAGDTDWRQKQSSGSDAAVPIALGFLFVIIVSLLVGFAGGIVYCRKVMRPSTVIFEKLPVADSLSSTTSQSFESTDPDSPAVLKTSRALFGIVLGETLQAVRSRRHVAHSSYQFADTDHPSEVWDLVPTHSQVKSLRITSYNGRVSAIFVDFPDATPEHFKAIRQQLLRTYSRSETNSIDPLTGAVQFDTEIDGVPVRITARTIGAGENGMVELSYTHKQLAAQAASELQKIKSEKVIKQLQ